MCGDGSPCSYDRLHKSKRLGGDNRRQLAFAGQLHCSDGGRANLDRRIRTFQHGPFGEAITLSYRWTLTDSGNKVHFQYVYNSNGSEEQRPDKEWEVKEKDNNKLVVNERETQADYTGEPNRCIYIRQ